MSLQLPVYEVSAAPADTGILERLAARLFGVDELEIGERDTGLFAQAGAVQLELDRVSGGIRAADTQRLWQVSEKPTPVPADEAYKIADQLLGEIGVLPAFADGEPFALSRLEAGGTVVATAVDGHRNRRRLDVQARYGVTVRNPGVDGQPDLLPIVGGGGKFSLSLGDEGRPIGFQGLWRPAGRAKTVPALDAGEAVEQYRKLFADVEIADVKAYLAYHAAPVGEASQFLTPVWVVGSQLKVGKGVVPARLVTIPATDFGPLPPEPRPQPVRDKQSRAFTTAGNPAGDRAAVRVNGYEAGTSWIGLSGGLAGSQANAQGFVDGLAADGWAINFNWGDANAWESDWRRNDDSYVDAADFVFYTGHADRNGWMLSSPDDGSLSFSEVGGSPGNPGDLWGRQDLEWAIIAACGPLQDDILSAGGGNVLGRWDGAFDGLHILMGYGAVTFDNTLEGSRVVQYARGGTPLIDAWFRAAQDIQPATNGWPAPNGPTIWVGAMWVTKPGVDPRFDHLWGHGSVSADPTSPTGLICMWTTC